MRKRFLVIGIILLFVGVSIIPSMGVNIVKKHFPDIIKTTIQDLIDNASDGDSIYIPSGTYYENIVINKSISLIGNDMNNTIIDGGGYGIVVSIIVDFVNISGFTFKNSGMEMYEAGIKILSKHNIITGNNIILNNNGIILMYPSSNNIITGNSFSNNTAGIDLEEGSSNTIKDNIISNNLDGINLWYSSNNNIITDNNIPNNNCGVDIFRSRNNTITDNSIINNGVCIALSETSGNNITGNTMVGSGILISGYMLEYWNTQVIDTSNTVNGKPVIYWKNQIGGTIPTDAGQVILANCTDIVVENQNISSGYTGIELGFSSSCTITGNNISTSKVSLSLECSDDNNVTNNNGGGRIQLYGSDGNNIISNDQDVISLYEYSNNNLISGNNITNNSEYIGIYLGIDSDNNIVTCNNIISNNNGIYLYYSNGNIIIGNNISSNNYDGISLWNSIGNNITGNNISSNKKYGIALGASSNINTIYHNNFINNTQNAYDECKNIWDDSYPSGGNFWDDYNGTDGDGDGIGDTPYPIPGGDNKDRYPLGNFLPGTPIINGPNHGKPGVEYTYCVNLSDPDNDSLFVFWDWGDGTSTEWLGPYSSGEEICTSHTWNKKGIYIMSVTVKDEYGATVIAYKEVTMPRNRVSYSSLFFRFLEQFPNAFPIIRFVIRGRLA